MRVIVLVSFAFIFSFVNIYVNNHCYYSHMYHETMMTLWSLPYILWQWICIFSWEAKWLLHEHPCFNFSSCSITTLVHWLICYLFFISSFIYCCQLRWWIGCLLSVLIWEHHSIVSWYSWFERVFESNLGKNVEDIILIFIFSPIHREEQFCLPVYLPRLKSCRFVY